MTSHPFRASLAVLWLSLGIALAGCGTPADAGRDVAAAKLAASEQTQPIAKGQKYVMATHSFNVFIGPTRSRDANEPVRPGPLAALAEERGKTGHEALAVQMIGGSTPMQHWSQGDGDDTKNLAKVALRQGRVDVFTMSPNARMP
jgi:hypothetical protein